MKHKKRIPRKFILIPVAFVFCLLVYFLLVNRYINWFSVVANRIPFNIFDQRKINQTDETIKTFSVSYKMISMVGSVVIVVQPNGEAYYRSSLLEKQEARKGILKSEDISKIIDEFNKNNFMSLNEHYYKTTTITDMPTEYLSLVSDGITKTVVSEAGEAPDSFGKIVDTLLLQVKNLPKVDANDAEDFCVKMKEVFDVKEENTKYFIKDCIDGINI